MCVSLPPSLSLPHAPADRDHHSPPATRPVPVEVQVHILRLAVADLDEQRDSNGRTALLTACSMVCRVWKVRDEALWLAAWARTSGRIES